MTDQIMYISIITNWPLIDGKADTVFFHRAYLHGKMNGDREETASPRTEFGTDIDSCLLFRKIMRYNSSSAATSQAPGHYRQMADDCPNFGLAARNSVRRHFLCV